MIISNKIDVKQADQSVTLFFDSKPPNDGALYKVGYKLAELIEKEQAGYYDWHCISEDGTRGWLYMYGPDADKLFEIVKPVFEKTSFLKKGTAIIKYEASGSERDYKVIEL